MAASTTDKLTNTASTTTSRAQPTQVTAARSAGVFTLSCNALTGWPTSTDSKVHFITYKITTAGAKIAGSQIDMDGIVSGTSIGSITIRGGTDTGNAIGDIVEMAPTNAWGYDLYQWGSAHANKDGSLLTAAVQTALGSGSQALNGYNALAFPFNTVTYNGNRSYTCVINTQDLTGTLSPGMRIRTQRTVAAPTQSTSLNGTNQYWSKTAPAGMTFTDDFVASAWVKLSAYADQNIISRFDGTNGWRLNVVADGRINLQAYNGSGVNFSQVVSYQSVPLNKWVHITAQLDMSAFTATTTTSYIMVDGVDVPAQVIRGGTNPTALVQAGTLQVGASNSTGFLSGKVAQAAVFNAKVLQATIQSYISQGLAGTETSLVSAYSFSGNANDLNTTNANNLSSNNGVTSTNADSPFGTQGDGTISSTLDYGIVQKATFSTNTTVIVQVAEGCTIPTSGSVASVAYSSNAVPFNFPEKNKFTICAYYKNDIQQTIGTLNTWYNIMQVSSPAGTWKPGYETVIFANGSSNASGFVTMSTANNTESDSELTGRVFSSSAQIVGMVTRQKRQSIVNNSAATLYINVKSDVATTISVSVLSSTTTGGTQVLYLENAYA